MNSYINFFKKHLSASEKRRLDIGFYANVDRHDL